MTHDLVALEGIRALMADYIRFTDNGRIDDFAALFGSDGIFILPDGGAHAGRAAIAALLNGHQTYFTAHPEAGPPGYLRHNLTTLSIELDGPDRARADSYFLSVTSERVDHWGKWTDELVCGADGKWRFAKRVVTTDGFDPDGWFAKSFSQM